MQYINRNKLTQMCCDVKKLFSDKPGITKNLSELFHALIFVSVGDYHVEAQKWTYTLSLTVEDRLQ